MRNPEWRLEVSPTCQELSISIWTTHIVTVDRARYADDPALTVAFVIAMLDLHNEGRDELHYRA
jgi:hypothetical protein